MASRAVLLPTTAWPFIIRLWLENFKTWEDKVDKVYLGIKDTLKPEFLTYLKDQITKMGFSDKIVFVQSNAAWTDTYTEVYKASKEDLFMIMHDDTYINDPGMIDRNFKLAEEGKVVTPMWDSLGPKERAEAWLKEKYPGVFPIGTDHDQYMFVLVLIFISRENLEKTRIDFNGFQHEAGIGFDMGGKIMLDLLDNGVKIHPLIRYHNRTMEACRDHPHAKENPEYLHFSALASSVPPKIDSDDPPHFNWDIPGLKLKLDHIEKVFELDDFALIAEYRDFVKKRIREIKQYE